jgi:hypothetical protein
VERTFVEKSKDQEDMRKRTTRRVCSQNDNTFFYTSIAKLRGRKQKKFESDLTNSSFNIIILSKEQEASILFILFTLLLYMHKRDLRIQWDRISEIRWK